MRTMRLDDDVWAECQKLGKAHGTINEGLRKKILPFGGDAIPTTIEEIREGAEEANAKGWKPLDPKYEKALPAARKFKLPLLKPSEKKK